MLILIPWKPVVLAWGLLSGLLLLGYIGTWLMEGKNPFAPHTIHMQGAAKQPSSHTAQSHKSIHKVSRLQAIDND
jgi:hypothetical protein